MNKPAQAPLSFESERTQPFPPVDPRPHAVFAQESVAEILFIGESGAASDLPDREIRIGEQPLSMKHSNPQDLGFGVRPT